MSFFGASSIRLILWSYSYHFSHFLNFFLLNKCIKGQIYSRKSFGFVGSSFLLISYCSLSSVSIVCALLTLNIMSWYYVLYIFGHLVNHIVSIFQFTSRLCSTSQLYLRNMSVLFKLVTTMSIHSLCLLISTLNSTNCIISPFLVPSTLETSNAMSAGFILIHSFLTNCLSISVCVHSEFISTYSHNFFPICIFTFACMFSSLSLLFC